MQPATYLFNLVLRERHARRRAGERLVDFSRPRHQGHLSHHSEGLRHVRHFHEALLGGGADDEEAPAVLRSLLDQNEQALHDGVAEAGPDGRVVNQALDVVEDDQRLGRFVGVVERLVDRVHPRELLASVLRGDDLDEGEVGHGRHVGGQSGLPAAHRTLQQRGQHGRLLRLLHLARQDGAGLQHLVELLAVGHNAVAREPREVVRVHAVGRLHLAQGEHEVRLGDDDLVHVLGLGDVAAVHVALDGVGHGALHHALDLRARVVLGPRANLLKVHVVRQPPGLAHHPGVDFENLSAPRLVRQAHLDVHLEAPGAQQRLVDHVEAVRHPDQQDVVERVDPVDLGEQLVDDAVAGPGAGGVRAPALANGVDFVEDDDVQAGAVARARVLLLGVLEEVAHVLLRLAEEAAHDLRPVDDFGLVAVERLRQLARDERLARAGRPVQQHSCASLHFTRRALTFDVRYAELLQELRRVDARGEGAAEDVGELGVEAANAHFLEVEVRLQDPRVLGGDRVVPPVWRHVLELHLPSAFWAERSGAMFVTLQHMGPASRNSPQSQRQSRLHHRHALRQVQHVVEQVGTNAVFQVVEVDGVLCRCGAVTLCRGGPTLLRRLEKGDLERDPARLRERRGAAPAEQAPAARFVHRGHLDDLADRRRDELARAAVEQDVARPTRWVLPAHRLHSHLPGTHLKQKIIVFTDP
ncbi:uncharacterized protein BcabD6B2_31810 [Babesia caballi]|uniref:Uncharacterized protein n=1 Tax=Babesia caballi TaxID=5871 RepID=A0AAV4LX91_BABCB|nr:hypothetical protein BcabD6B2_31810 [Babesia caballi]